MAVTITLVDSGPNHLRYLATATGAETGTLSCSGAPSPDVLTDAPGGQLKQIANVNAAGYGQLAAGTQTQAKARALFAADDPTNLVGTNMMRAITHLTPRSAITAHCDWDVDGNGFPELDITFSGAGSVYVDIFLPGAIGR